MKEEINSQKENEIVSKLYEAANANFESLSSQRLKFIRFYIVIMGVALSGVGYVFFKAIEDIHTYVALLIVAGSFAVITWVFSIFDTRTTKLLEVDFNALKHAENHFKKQLELDAHNNLYIFTQANELPGPTISYGLAKLFCLSYALSFMGIMYFVFCIGKVLC
jgi:hypothetical protein